ncbi:MAG: Enoyl-[acyl-carrier-protein] reductase [Bacteriovoracaceae bacterium]|nr:Enoyl-[acyl-carrier-protein] reductase [Bacteriovoracaceae bacterium]
MNLNGKKALIMGLANERSIAYGIAKALKGAGAELGFTYIDVVEKRMRPLAEEMDASLIAKCDVASDQDIAALAETVEHKWNNQVDILIHSLAYADREDLEKEFVFTSRKGFQTALDISAYSLVAVTKALLPALEATKGSVLAMSYYGAERVVPNYNVMGVAKAALESCVRYLAADGGARGIRVNAISAGPIRTLAASGVKDFRSILTKIEEKSPLRRNITTDEVGSTALFLSSEAARGITGQILYVDSGYSIMGL